MDPNIDPLDANVNDIDTSYPVITAGLYDLKIGQVKKEPTKDGSGERLTVPLTTTTEATTTKQETVPAGHQITHYIGLTPSEKPGKRPYTNSDIAKGIAAVAKSAGISVSPRAVIDNPSVLDGKVVRAKVGVNKETDEFPESNKVKDFVVIK